MSYLKYLKPENGEKKFKHNFISVIFMAINSLNLCNYSSNEKNTGTNFFNRGMSEFKAILSS